MRKQRVRLKHHADLSTHFVNVGLRIKDIDAVNNIKKLRLTNCINITGVGLDPLWGSTIIEQIDLSLVGDHEEPTLTEIWHPPIKMDYWCSREDVVVPFDPPISCELVLPILDSIIERKGNLLKHLQLLQPYLVMIVHYDVIGIGDLEEVWCPFSTLFGGGRSF